MLYRRFKDKELSALGMGCMRLPTLSDGRVDEDAVRDMVAWAMRQGVNYYDTAWGYHDGQSEEVLGRVLSAWPRDSFYLATKFPGYDLANMGHAEEIFEKQLQKCQTSYFDFYLVHNVCEMNIDAYLDDARYGDVRYLIAQKKAGRIRHLGFSAHGSEAVIRRFLDAWGEHMEFGQLQLNYLDWEFQSAGAKAALLTARGLPVWVMEPLRGGRLAALDTPQAEKLAALRPQESAVGWAFRFLQSLPEVTMVLSGMSDMAQLQENVRIFSEDAPLNDTERAALLEVARDMVQRIALPCTACRYCTSHCPQQLDIPNLLALYNEHCFTGGGFLAPMAVGTLPPEKRPDACLACHSCEKVCPQGIRIADAMADFAKKLGG